MAWFSDRAAARKDLAGYYVHCAALEDCIAELLGTLRETGPNRNTIIVFTSDHGDMIESDGQQRKQRLWEESARVPMLFRLPESHGIQPRRVEGTINTEDVMPTLLSLYGRPIPKSAEGFDFAGYLRGGAVVRIPRAARRSSAVFHRSVNSHVPGAGGITVRSAVRNSPTCVI